MMAMIIVAVPTLVAQLSPEVRHLPEPTPRFRLLVEQVRDALASSKHFSDVMESQRA